MELTKKTAAMVATTTIVAGMADIIIYSIGTAKQRGGGFKLYMPKTKDLLQILAIGLAMGVAIDFISGKLEDLLMTPEEKELRNLIESEVKLINKGERKNQEPVQIAWKNITLRKAS
jgi:hypothetical protein